MEGFAVPQMRVFINMDEQEMNGPGEISSRLFFCLVFEFSFFFSKIDFSNIDVAVNPPPNIYDVYENPFVDDVCSLSFSLLLLLIG
jgi:hypothetical protein